MEEETRGRRLIRGYEQSTKSGAMILDKEKHEKEKKKPQKKIDERLDSN